MASKNIESLCFLLTVITFSLLSQSLARPTPPEDAFLLRQIADSYSAPLVASFLHLRIQNTARMIEDIRNSLTNLNSNQRNMFTLKLKSLNTLDHQLTLLQKTTYFIMDGTERVKNLIEQYILNSELFPTQLGSDEGKFNSTPDELMKKLNIVSNDQLINDTNDLINMHLNDMEEKSSNVKYNQLERLAASVTKSKLKQLLNFKYSEPTIKHDDGGNAYYSTDDRTLEIESVLRQLKNILDLFYSQLENLESQNSESNSLIPIDNHSVQSKRETQSDDTSTESVTASSFWQ